MFNPVSFRRVVEVWDAEDHLAVAKSTYRRFEVLLGCKLWHDVPVIRMFPNADYADVWRNRLQEGHPVSKWMEWTDEVEGAHAQHGAGKVTGSGWVHVPLLLDAWRDWASQNPDRFAFESGTWNWEDGLPSGFDGLVDARGVGAVADLKQWGIQVNPNHGEVLTLRSGVWPHSFTLNANKWALPQPDGGARLGATYVWNIPDNRTTASARTELISSLNHVLQTPFRPEDITDHQAGLRPASPDRRPMVGRLSAGHPWYHMLNGLGTRGVLVGPRAAQDLARQVIQDLPVRESTDPRRFRSFREID